MHFVLGNNRRKICILTRFGFSLNRQVFGQLLFCNHYSCGMNTDAAFQTLETSRSVDDGFDIWIALIERSQFCCSTITVNMLFVLFKAIFEWCVSPHHYRWHRLSDLVAQAIRKPQHSCRIAHGIAGFDRAESDDLSDMIATVLFRRVSNHFIAISRVEVHVDIWHRSTSGVQESLEQQVVLDRIKICNSQRICNSAASGRTTTRADAN